MNPSIDPKALEDMDRQSLRSIHYISLIVLVIEIGLEIVFFSAHLEHMDHQAVLSLVSVSYCIAFCAAGSLISRKMMQLETIRHSRFFLFKIIFFILFIVWAIFADYRHYKAGDQMLTFWVVNLVMICFILFRPWIGVLLVGGAFAGLYIPLYLYNGAQDIVLLNFIVLALASMASNAIRFHAQINASSKAVRLSERNADLKDKSHRDGLTGLLNRLALEEDAGKMDGRKMTAYMIDINYFKEINDRYGHAAGDAVLRETSETLKRLYPGARYYRYGGDEFLVLTYKPAEKNYGSDTFDLRQEEYGVKALLSIGNAQGTPAAYQDLFDLISRADKALYVTKQRTHSAEFGGHDRRKARRPLPQDAGARNGTP